MLAISPNGCCEHALYFCIGEGHVPAAKVSVLASGPDASIFLCYLSGAKGGGVVNIDRRPDIVDGTIEPRFGLRADIYTQKGCLGGGVAAGLRVILGQTPRPRLIEVRFFRIGNMAYKRVVIRAVSTTPHASWIGGPWGT